MKSFICQLCLINSPDGICRQILYPNLDKLAQHLSTEHSVGELTGHILNLWEKIEELTEVATEHVISDIHALKELTDA